MVFGLSLGCGCDLLEMQRGASIIERHQASDNAEIACTARTQFLRTNQHF